MRVPAAIVFAGIGLAFSCNAAAAVDLLLPAAEVVVSEPDGYNWTGFYAGVYGGLGNSSFYDEFNGQFATGSGALAGVTVGYTHQIDSIVFGVEADLALAGLGGAYDAALDIGSGKASLNSVGTARGKLGVAFGPGVVYATGGVAVGNVTDSFSALSDSNWMGGWTAGLGVEIALSEQISLDLRYLHLNLGPTSFFDGAFNEEAKANLITAGLNFRF